MSTMQPAEARAVLTEFVGTYGMAPEPVERVEERTLRTPHGDLRIRLMWPPLEPDERAPALLFFHGGGWVLGDLDSHNEICRALVHRAPCVVASLEYRLSPENQFPAPLEDALAALEWLHDEADSLGIDRRRIAVGGDSAGGNIAASLAIEARNRRGPPVAHQLLIYPITHHECEDASFAEFGADCFLTTDTMLWFWDQYLPDSALGKDPRASVMLERSLDGLPQTTLLTAECDPLRDQGEAYGRRLAEAGVAVCLRREREMCHGFLSMGREVPHASRVIDWLAAAIANQQPVSGT